ncbi:MAG: hypothetical protein Q8N63_01760 [Nanoarchaeota archaeon]|nr:hypothetical protein [Nanoarchaeota archaeon]
MKLSDVLTIISYIINLAIFIYFVVVLIKLNALDYAGLLISAFGIFISLLSGIVVALEKK